MVVVVVVGGACPKPPGAFGAVCDDRDVCDGLQCRDGRCVPPRAPGDAGEGCENAIAVDARAAPAAVVIDELVFFGKADDDADVCGSAGVPDVSLRFTLAEAVGLTITVDDPAVTVALRPWNENGCGIVERFGCATRAAPALLPAVAAGEWELVLDGAADRAGEVDEPGVRVRVERVDCPLGGVPFDAEHCLAFVPQQPMLRARAGAGADRVDGGVVFVGGTGKDGIARDEGERFDFATESFSFVDIGFRRARPFVATVDRDNLEPQTFVFSNDADPITAETVTFNPAEASPLSARVDLTEFFDLIRGPRIAVLGRGGIFEPTIGPLDCTTDRSCGGAGVDCIDQVCRCRLSGSCQDPSLPGLVQVGFSGGFSDGSRGAFVNNTFLLVSVGGTEGAAYQVFVAGDEYLQRRPIAGVARKNAAVVGNARFGFVIGGTTVDGDQPSDLIERVEVLAETAEIVARLPRPMAKPRVARFADDLVIIADDDDDSDEFLLFRLSTETFERAPLLPAARRASSLMPVDDGVLVAGGFDATGTATATVDRLTPVLRRAPLPTRVPPTCVAQELVMGTPAAGSTAGQLDHFRDELCFFNGVVNDEQWAFTLTAPASVRLVAEPQDFDLTGLRLTVTDALCSEGAAVTGCGVGEVFVPELPAGTWYVSVETVVSPASPDPDLLRARRYTLLGITGAPEACAADDEDPGDAELTGAVTATPEGGGRQLAEGGLCAGDVDYVVFEFPGGSTSQLAVGLTDERVEIAPAVIDVAASRPGSLVVSATSADFVPLLTWDSTQQPTGIYVARLGPVAGLRARLGWFLQVLPFCEQDPFDSILPDFDDANALELATRLSSGGSVNLDFCYAGDRDVVIFEPTAGRDVIVELSELDFIPELFEFDGTALGSPIDADFEVIDDDVLRVVLPPRTAPFAVRVSPGPSEDFFNANVVVSLDQPPPGDRCDDALPLPLSGSFSTSSAEYIDDLNAGGIGNCTSFSSPGEDFVFFVDLDAGGVFNATVDPVGDFDPTLYLLSACPAGDGLDVCVVGNDEGSRGQPDSITFTNTGPAARFFFVVDSFFGESYDVDVSWTIN